MNHHDLNQKDLSEIKAALLGKDMLFDRLGIDQSRINAVQQYEWKLDGDEYEKCKKLAASKYVQSPRFEYHVDLDDAKYIINFHFNFFGRISSDDKEYCGIFVEIDEMPEDVQGITIEVDIKCNDKRAYRHLIREQQLTQKKRKCGFRIFATSVLDKNEYFEWTFGVKIFNAKVTESDIPLDGLANLELDDLYRTLSHLY